VKKICLSIATTAVLVMAGATAGFTAELPTYEATGFPISPVQTRVLGAANVQQAQPTASSTITPVQLSVLTPRAKTTTATRTVGSVR
jgi:hypothetical protein